MKKRVTYQKSRQTHRRHLMRGTVLILLLVLLLAGFLLASSRSMLPLPFSGTLPETEQTSQAGGGTSDNPWYLTLVNKENPIPQQYPINLVQVPGGEQVDERIYKPLMELLEAAKEGNAGQLPLVVSGYRTPEKQQSLYDNKVSEYRRQGYSEGEAREMANQWVSVPGYSEHQLGFAVDINGATYDVYLWLQENSYKYGFIFRYPGDKTEITGAAEEVWHYRYVGTEAAKQIHDQGICLEEYLGATQ